MPTTFPWRGLLVLILLLLDSRSFAASMVIFDFDDFTSSKGVTASSVESYMEGLFGSDITLSQKTNAVNSSLKVGKGKGAPEIAIDFGTNPVESFSIDFQLFKNAKSFKILADGVIINQQNLSKAQRKTGLTGHQGSYFFDTPVQRLQFVGLQKKSFAIDNLVINIPLPSGQGLDALDNSSEESTSYSNDNGNNSSRNILISGAVAGGDSTIANVITAEVPEPSSLLLLAVGLYGAQVSRRRR